MFGFYTQMQNTVTSSKELENTFKTARVQGLAQKYQRKIEI